MKLNKYTVGRRYGKALFELAIEQGQAEAIYQELLLLREIYHELPDLGNILSDARLELYEKDQILETLLTYFDGTIKHFLSVVHRYRRMNDLLLMIDEYEHRYDEYQQLILGTVTTAVPLLKAQHQTIEEQVARLFGYQHAQLINLIDPNIIGGVIVEANHQVIDGSVRRQLKMMRQLLTK